MEVQMELLRDRCAGLDVHKKSVVACARVQSGASAKNYVRSFGTTTSALFELAAWLSSHGVHHVVMEATGVYWKPVWHILEEDFELLLANAKHVKGVPGRKSDVKDAQWLAELLAHGLVTGSFVPDEPIQELRDLVRTRKQIVRERVRHVQRIQKVLEDANIKLSSYISDIMGLSGQKILQALISGEDDPAKLAALAHSRLKASQTDLVEALRGRVTDHHRFMLRLHLEHIDAIESSLSTLDEEIDRCLEPFRLQVNDLKTIPGVSDEIARVIIAEIGTDMSRFPSAAHLVSWAGLCPRSDESAGKRRSTRIRKGAPWLKTALVQSAWAASRKKDSHLRAKYLRLKYRRGAKKAAVAVAASILTSAYHMLANGEVYEELGYDHVDRRREQRVVNSMLKRLDRLGFDVTVNRRAEVGF